MAFTTTAIRLILPVLSTLAVISFADVFDAFDDSIHYDVVWGDPKLDFKDGKENMIIKTANSEEYICQIPSLSSSQSLEDIDADVSARDIIAKLETDKSCSYRVDSYWIYEVCHGQKIRQFHEERDVNNKKVLVKQSYNLGYINYDSYTANMGGHIPTLNHAGALRPYYSALYSGGTDCDLKPGFKRESVVIYMCMPDFQTSVVSVKETSTCKYEIIIYTSLLCKNILYRVKEDPTNHIYCLSKDGNKWQRPIGYNDLALQKKDTLFDFIPLKDVPVKQTPAVEHPKQNKNPPSKEPKKSQLTFPEKNFIKYFLSGEKCVVGGVGWWKYEFCYLKSLKQFHQDKKGMKTEILLGIWDENRHIEHMNENGKTVEQSKGPTFTDLHFFLGNICDETGLPRQVQVRIRCSNHSNVQALTMFMEEPKVCVYKFTAESVLFCKVLSSIDKFGIPRVSVDDIIEGLETLFSFSVLYINTVIIDYFKSILRNCIT